MTPFLYHLTYHGRLPSVAEEGLRPGEAPSIGGSPYTEHRAGAVFLTAGSGVPFWHERAEEWAHHSADDLLAEGYVPVVLRIQGADCEPDELGTQDARHPAYRCLAAVDPEDIELWDGAAWIPVSDYEALDPSLALDDEGYMLGTWDNVLVPTEAERNPATIKRRLLAYDFGNVRNPVTPPGKPTQGEA